MATPAMIAIRNDDGSFVSIRCSYDGHPGGVGARLLKSWAHETRVRSLLALGDLSRIGGLVGRKRPHDIAEQIAAEYTDEDGNVDWGEAMSDKRMVDHNRACLSYKRDYERDDADPVPYGSWEIFREAMFGCKGQYGPGYIYVFDVLSGEWCGAKADAEVYEFPDLIRLDDLLTEYEAELEAQTEVRKV